MTETVEDFMAGLGRLGASPERRGGLVAYVVEPVSGRLAGELVTTAVESAELAAWPIAPPHWLHLPATITFASTNSQPSPLPGWLRHSRQITGWGADRDPAQAWLAHVRGVVGQAR
jgi:hypothetical protein